MQIVFAMAVTRELLGGPLTFRCLDGSHQVRLVRHYADAAPGLQVDSRGRHNVVQ
jgi:hypothetical protein